LKKSAGARCLIIFEGLDEIAMERQTSDEFLLSVIKECTLLEQATILITSRPHACEMVKAGRRVEIVGFGDNEIRQFVEKSFANASVVEDFLLQLNDFPHIRSLCYIPINLVMIVDIFQVNKKRLPSTLTELYKLFMIMLLQRQVKKENEKKKKPELYLHVVVPTIHAVMLHELLKGAPREAIRTMFAL